MLINNIIIIIIYYGCFKNTIEINILYNLVNKN